MSRRCGWFRMFDEIAVIDAPAFYAGVVLHDDTVIRAAPIIKYMIGWPRARVLEYCVKRGWHLAVVGSLQ
jgi:hypothetical protein